MVYNVKKKGPYGPKIRRLYSMKKSEKLMREVASQLGKSYEEY